MRKIKYTQEQINELLKNKYVKSCTSKNITFTKELKEEALELEYKWIFRKEIFKNLWFPEYVYNSMIPTKSIDRWKRNLNKKWIIEESKWRKKKEKIDFNNMTLEEENEYLKAENAYLKELKKLIEWNYP